MELKRARVDLTKTDTANEGCILIKNKNIYIHNSGYKTQEWLDHINVISYDMHITIAGDIEEGEWCFYKGTKEAIKYPKGGFPKNYARKIIATTNKFLGRTKIYRISEKGETLQQDERGTYEWEINKFPQPRNSFVGKYVEVSGIDTVLVEYEERGSVQFWYEYDKLKQKGLCDNPDKFNYIPKLKIDSHNTITIKALKDSWSKKELDIIVEKALVDGISHGKSIGTYIMSDLGSKYAPLTEDSYKNEWMDKNLKI